MATDVNHGATVVGGEGDELGIFFSYCTMAFISWFHVTTPSSHYIKVIAQLTNCNLAMGIMPKLALDHVQIWVSRVASSHCQTRFSPQTAWQPIFGCIFLHIFHNNSVAFLKQSCSPLIDLQDWCGELGQNPYGLKVTRPQSWANITNFRLKQ
jgi:hypothetical protein